MPSDAIAQLRLQLLEATLPHIPFDGWTVEALERAASDLGLDDLSVIRAFPGGAAELVRFHSAHTDEILLDELAGRNLESLRVRERVATGVRVRLELLADQREAVRRALSFLAMPQNTLLALRCVYQTVDTIWYAAGDTATDWNFYSKRGLLAAVYTSTVLYWLEDESDGVVDTWAFLDRRISDVMKVPKAVARCRQILPNPLRLFGRRRAA